ncbi:hypothetical protein MIND_00690100 [Mycena indigotica]|uniref:Vesicle transport protein USE1 n=1 Tax=Mycena indigotica TaxID=2126181 RepID=A0A8H6SLK7_9AGAR|nr:uncharacterized protein MIND_00690100 [Mycena indigotica]KAF7301253.1 hypothetical protein MIND_00690100 [Mycena indigotica]
MPIASHDEINLKRLVRRLEKSAVDSQWPPTAGDTTYIKVQSSLQKVKYARKLLANVESERPLTELKAILDRVDSFLTALASKTIPESTRPVPILPTLPLPLLPPEPEPEPEPVTIAVSPPPEYEATPVSLPPDTLIPLTTTLLPSEKPTKSTAVQQNPTLQHATLRQREMADQMAVMAEQLKRNSVYFAELLEKDKRAMEETEAKLEGNYGFMQKTRLRTRDLRGKTGGTTCLVLLIIVFVTVLFMFMVSLIRFSGR